MALLPKKKRIKYNPDYVAQVIKERRFVNLPEWLVKMVDTKVFEKLLECMGEVINEEYNRPPKELVSDEYKACLEFITDCITNGLAVTRVCNHIARKYDQTSKVANVIPYLITLDNEWQMAYMTILSKWLPNMSHDDAIDLLFEYRQAFFINMGQVSVALTDMISKINVDYIVGNAGTKNVSSYNTIDETRRTNVHNLMYKLGQKPDDKFYTECISIGATLANTKYPMLREKYTFMYIWQTIPSFYPTNIKDYMVATSYVYMVAHREEPVNMSDNIYPVLQRMMFEHRGCHSDIVPDIIDYIAKATEKDVNNVRFFVPFKEITTTYEETDDFVSMRTMATALKNTIKSIINDKNQHLIDFKYLYDNYKSPIILSNSNLQRAFILSGGKAYTLTKSHLGTDTQSAIYDAEGLDLAIRNSKCEDLIILLEDEEIVSIIGDQLVGKVRYYNTISFVVQAILRMKKVPEYLELLLSKIRAAYPTDPNETDAYKLRISNVHPSELKTFDYSTVAMNIPVSKQAYQRLVSYITTSKKYVPLYYGINQEPELDKLMPIEFIDKIVDVSPGYIGDISSEAIGKSMLLKHSS